MVAGPVSHQDGGGYEPPLRLGLLSLRSPRGESNTLSNVRSVGTVHRRGGESVASLAGVEPARQASEAQYRPPAETAAPSTGLEPVVNRLEGGVPSVGRGHGVERGSRTLFRGVAIRVLSSQFPTLEGASVMGRPLSPVCLSFDRCRAVDGFRAHHTLIGNQEPSLEGRPHCGSFCPGAVHVRDYRQPLSADFTLLIPEGTSRASTENRTRSVQLGRLTPHLENARKYQSRYWDSHPDQRSTKPSYSLSYRHGAGYEYCPRLNALTKGGASLKKPARVWSVECLVRMKRN